MWFDRYWYKRILRGIRGMRSHAFCIMAWKSWNGFAEATDAKQLEDNEPEAVLTAGSDHGKGDQVFIDYVDGTEGGLLFVVEKVGAMTWITSDNDQYGSDMTRYWDVTNACHDIMVLWGWWRWLEIGLGDGAYLWPHDCHGFGPHFSDNLTFAEYRVRIIAR